MGVDHQNEVSPRHQRNRSTQRARRDRGDRDALRVAVSGLGTGVARACPAAGTTPVCAVEAGASSGHTGQGFTIPAGQWSGNGLAYPTCPLPCTMAA